MDAEQMLGVLLNMTKKQSDTTETLLTALEEQIQDMSAATEANRLAASSVNLSAAVVGRAAKDASADMQRAASAAVGVAVKEAFVGVSETAVAALDVAAKPFIGRLAGVSAAAGEIETTLKRAVARFGWKWALLAGGAAVGGIAAVLLTGWLTVWWERHELDLLSVQKIELQNDVAELQASVVALEKKGGRIKFGTCGPKNRLCIEGAGDQGNGLGAWVGAWSNRETKTQMVIPKGY